MRARPKDFELKHPLALVTVLALLLIGTSEKDAVIVLAAISAAALYYLEEVNQRDSVIAAKMWSNIAGIIAVEGAALRVAGNFYRSPEVVLLGTGVLCLMLAIGLLVGIIDILTEQYEPASLELPGEEPSTTFTRGARFSGH